MNIKIVKQIYLFESSFIESRCKESINTATLNVNELHVGIDGRIYCTASNRDIGGGLTLSQSELLLCGMKSQNNLHQIKALFDQKEIERIKSLYLNPRFQDTAKELIKSRVYAARLLRLESLLT